MFSFFVVSIPTLLTQSVVALQAVPSLTSRQDPATQEDEECREPGKLFFSHIMKDGGSSVDAYLNCICEKSTCSIWHVESQKLLGKQKCYPPTVCSSHEAVYKRSNPTECGSAFSNSTVFTALRDPVDRLYSFYTYMRYKKQDTYFVGKTFDEILENYESCYENYDWFVCAELNNTMVGKYFNNPLTDQLRQVRPDEELIGQTFRRTSTADLDSAKTMLASFGAIFFAEDFGRFTDLFFKSGLPLARQAYECDFPHDNENVCDFCDPEPTKQALKMINKLNWADIELYNYAKNLSNRVQ